MNPVRLLIVVALIALVCWVLLLLPLPAPFGTVLIVVAVLCCLLYVARELGVGI